MVEIDADPRRQLITMTLSERVSAAEMEASRERLAQELDSLEPGFIAFTDLSRLSHMENAAVEQVAACMELLNSKGVGRIVRLIPDRSKDIGFALLAIFHYDAPVPTVTCETVEEAVRALEP